MSTQSAKPVGPTDRSDCDSSPDSERSGAEWPRVEEEAVRSPYAPKVMRGSAGGEPVGTGDDVPPPPRFLLASRHASGAERSLTDFSDSVLQFQDKAAEESVSQERLFPESEPRRLQPRVVAGQALRLSSPAERQPVQNLGRDQAVIGRRNPLVDDDELKRLEDSVRELQREAAANWSRGSERSALHPDDARGRRRLGETSVDGGRAPPSLQPEIMAAPPEPKAGRGRMQMLLSVLIASIISAPVAYYFASGEVVTRPVELSDTTLASKESQPVVTASIPVRTESIRPLAPQSAESNALPESPRGAAVAPQVTAVPQREAAPQAEPPMRGVNVDRSQQPPVQPQAQPLVPQQVQPQVPQQAQPQVPPQRPPLRVLDQSAIDVLVAQGQQFIAVGDFVTARTVFQRAAEAGSAVAALALGASYDPVVLGGLGARGVESDVSKARIWYQRAKEFGAPEADRRLDVLANR